MCPERERERERERKREREMEWDNVSRGREGGMAGGREGGREREMEWDIAVGALDAAHEQPFDRSQAPSRAHSMRVSFSSFHMHVSSSRSQARLRQGHIKGTLRAH